MIFKFVAGNNLNNALKYGKKNINNKIIPIINYISENNKNNIIDVFNEYNNLLNTIDSNYMIALKLSSLNFNETYINNLADICKYKNIKLIIDAEDNNNIDNYRKLTNKLINKYNKKINNNYTIIKTYQMYRKDSLLELYDDIKIFNNANCFFSSKLVRGAYYNNEYKKGHLYTNKVDTDNNYNLGIIKLNEFSNIENIIASHNKESINLAKDLNNNDNKFIIANLMGMNEKFMNNLNTKKAVYIPYGPYYQMIPYLIRRLYENMDQIKFMIN